jgi:hypothetical protein
MFQVPSTIQSVRTLVDGGTKLDVITRELNPEEMTELFKLKGSEGWMIFKENIINPEDVKDLPEVKIEKTDKSQGQRIRAVLYRLWEITGRTKTINEIYMEETEKYINSIKERLN